MHAHSYAKTNDENNNNIRVDTCEFETIMERQAGNFEMGLIYENRNRRGKLNAQGVEESEGDFLP